MNETLAGSRYAWMECEECGAIRERTPTGTVCPFGHGRIHPPLSRSQWFTLLRHRWALALPRAVRTKEGWLVDGSPVERLSNRGTVSVFEICEEPELIAVVVGKRICVRKFRRAS